VKPTQVFFKFELFSDLMSDESERQELKGKAQMKRKLFANLSSSSSSGGDDDEIESFKASAPKKRKMGLLELKSSDSGSDSSSDSSSDDEDDVVVILSSEVQPKRRTVQDMVRLFLQRLSGTLFHNACLFLCSSFFIAVTELC